MQRALVLAVAITGCDCSSGDPREAIEQASQRAEQMAQAPMKQIDEATRAANRAADEVAEVTEPLGRAAGEIVDDMTRSIATDNARREHLRQIAQALRAYHDREGHFPPAAVRDARGRRLLSWRVLILPDLGAADLFGEVHLDEPWDSEHNRALLPRMPEVFTPPGHPQPRPHETHYRAFVGDDAVLRDQPTTMADVTDPVGSTVTVIEARESVPWTKPEELTVDRDHPLPALGYLEPFVLGATVGGAVTVVVTSDPDEVRAVATRAGGEVISPPEGGGDLDWD